VGGNTKMDDPHAVEIISRDDIDTLERSDTSMMPAGQLNSLHEDEVLDLIAFLMSRGDSDHKMFRNAGGTKESDTQPKVKSTVGVQ
jgi:hypothetical protein